MKLSADLGLGAPETEFQGDLSAHSTHEGTGNTSSRICIGTGTPCQR